MTTGPKARISENIYPPGKLVKLIPPGGAIDHNQVDGRIIGVKIEGDHKNPSILYEIAWWNGLSRCKDYFSPDEFTAINESKIKIGFIGTYKE